MTDFFHPEVIGLFCKIIDAKRETITIGKIHGEPNFRIWNDKKYRHLWNNSKCYNMSCRMRFFDREIRAQFDNLEDYDDFRFVITGPNYSDKLTILKASRMFGDGHVVDMAIYAMKEFKQWNLKCTKPA